VRENARERTLERERVCVCERERERDGDRHTHIQTHTRTERGGERESDRHTHTYIRRGREGRRKGDENWKSNGDNADTIVVPMKWPTFNVTALDLRVHTYGEGEREGERGMKIGNIMETMQTRLWSP